MPNVIYHGGPVISNIEVVIVYYGSTFSRAGIGDWGTDPMLLDQACRLNDFFSDITDSAYLDQLTEYTPPGENLIGRGKWIGAAFIPFAPGKQFGSFADNALNDVEIRATLQIAIQQGQVPEHTPNRGYFVFLPPYIAVRRGDEFYPDDGQAYHDNVVVDGDSVSYAVMTHPGSNPVIPFTKPDTFEQLTVEASHELVEMITDPTAVAGWGWYDRAGNEIVDICVDPKANFPKWGYFHGYLVSTFWSEQQQSCSIPAEDGLAKSPRAVQIWGPRSECNIPPAEGASVIFHAELSNTPNVEGVTYQWSVVGADAIGPNNERTFSVQFPLASNQVVVSVMVTDADGCDLSDTQTFTPITQHQHEFLELLCELRKFIHVNFFVNPLWDPLRDLTTSPISEHDVRELHSVAEHMVQLTERLHGLYQTSRSQE